MQITPFLERAYLPFLGWTCSLSIFCDTVLRYFLSLAGIHVPDINLKELMGCITVVLGTGAFKIYEKKNKGDKV